MVRHNSLTHVIHQEQIQFPMKTLKIEISHFKFNKNALSTPYLRYRMALINKVTVKPSLHTQYASIIKGNELNINQIVNQSKNKQTYSVTAVKYSISEQW